MDSPCRHGIVDGCGDAVGSGNLGKQGSRISAELKIFPFETGDRDISTDFWTI